MNTLRVALAQINPTVGAFECNTSLILDCLERARQTGADLVAFPELALAGYPPEDLLMKPHFVRENRRALDRIVAAAGDLLVVVGFVDTDGSDIYNAAAVIAGDKLVYVYHKTFLPNYGVFDGERYFQAGTRCPVFVERLHDPRRRREKLKVSADAALDVIDLHGFERPSNHRAPLAARSNAQLAEVAETYLALVIGTRDYVRKNGFDKVYFGLSGGIDSALTAGIAPDAIWPEKINTLFIPTLYSSTETLRGSRELGEKHRIHFLGIENQK